MIRPISLALLGILLFAPPTFAQKKEKVKPNINASKEYPNVIHSPSADTTPKVFLSVLQLEMAVKRGDAEPVIVYADGAVVSKDGLLATVFEQPGKHESFAVIESVSVLMLDGSSAEAEVVSQDPAYGLAILRVKGVDLPTLRLSTKKLISGQHLNWHAVFRHGRKTCLYSRPLKIHKATHTVGETKDACLIIDEESSSLNAQRSGSALVAYDGSLVALMGRQPHWNVTPKNVKPRTKTAWAVPAHVIAKQLEKK